MSIPLTVALLTYNRSHYLRQSLKAIMDQYYTEFELLVLDNGSTDDTADVVLSMRDDRLRYVRNPPGYTARFNGLSAMWIARGERLLVTHDDDIMEPDMLQRQMALIAAQPDLTAVWTNQSIIDEHGRMLQPYLQPPGPDRIYARGEYIARAAEERLWHPPSSLIFMPRLLPAGNLRRAYVGAPGLRRRQAIDGSGDHILPATMNLHGAVAFINAPLLRYRQHGAQETHHVHLSQAVLHRFQTFRRFVRKTTYRDEYEPLFDAQVARYKAQDLVIRPAGAQLGKPALARLHALLERTAPGLRKNPRAGHALLPLVILLMQQGSMLASATFDAIPLPAADAQRSVRALYHWASCRRNGGNLFAGHRPGSRIALLGSVMVSALLINEARQAGLEVVCCLDSNTTRQGLNWLGLDIHPPAWLAPRNDVVAQVVLSSERDHEEELGKLIHGHAPKMALACWKDLALSA